MGLSFEDLTGVPGSESTPRRPSPRRDAGGARRVSMADVAARAGVSGQTVSRVVNGSPRVDPETRARVEAAMAALGYRPHRAARALRTGRTQTIGLVVSTLATVGNSRMLQAVADAAAARGYALTVVTLGADGVPAPSRRVGPRASSGPSSRAGRVAAAFDRLNDQGVDGVIVLNEATALAVDVPVPRDLSVVVVDAPRAGQRDSHAPPSARWSAVQSEHAGGARAAVEHLLSLGHRTVHHLAGPADSFAAAERERGWREALAAAGSVAADPIRGDWTAASGHRGGVALAVDPTVTAVFAANDQMALGAVRAMAEAGRDVPRDVSVVGFDDIADAADYRPPLTTVRQEFDRLGELAVTRVVAGIEDGAAGFDVVPTTLVLRESTSAPA